jgi:hypothetical protein
MILEQLAAFVIKVGFWFCDSDVRGDCLGRPGRPHPRPSLAGRHRERAKSFTIG